MWVPQEVVTNDKSSGGKAVESLHSKNSSIIQEFQLKKTIRSIKTKFRLAAQAVRFVLCITQRNTFILTII